MGAKRIKNLPMVEVPPPPSTRASNGSGRAQPAPPRANGRRARGSSRGSKGAAYKRAGPSDRVPTQPRARRRCHQNRQPGLQHALTTHTTGSSHIPNRRHLLLNHSTRTTPTDHPVTHPPLPASSTTFRLEPSHVHHTTSALLTP
ncbi:hypothetical protein MRX96_002631 [Rhipicephalus microplus]